MSDKLKITSVLLVLALLVTSLAPLATYDFSNVSGAGGGGDAGNGEHLPDSEFAGYIPISTPQELSWIGDMTNNGGVHTASYNLASYTWSADKNYYFVNDIVFDSYDSNGGLAITLVTSVDTNGKVTLTFSSTGTISGTAWVNGNTYSIASNECTISDLTAGKYTVAVGGVSTYLYTSFAYTFILDNSVSNVTSVTFNSNGNFSPLCSSQAFSGTLDGNGYTIQGMKMASYDSSQPLSLFAQLSASAEIKNLGITGGYFVSTSISSSVSIAPITASAQSAATVTNCYNSSAVVGCTTSTATANSTDCISGLVNRQIVSGCYNAGDITYMGRYTSTVCGVACQSDAENCYNTGNITIILTGSSSLNVTVGGVIGKGSVINCYNTGNIICSGSASGISFSDVGGVAGVLTGNADNCYNTGNINVNSNSQNVGGAFGHDSEGITTITGCYNLGSVTLNNDYGQHIYAGGIIGNYTGNISNCYNKGAISITSSPSLDYYQYVGGIGGGTSSGSIDQCYNTGNVVSKMTTSGNSSIAGGITGMGRNVSNCYNIGEISSTAQSTRAYSGGITGSSSYGVISDCYNVGSVNASGATQAVGGILGYAGNGVVCIVNCYYLSTSAPALYSTSSYIAPYIDGAQQTTSARGGITASGSKTEAQLKGSNNREIFYTSDTIFTINATNYNIPGWNFGTTWGIDLSGNINKGYPVLQVFDRELAITEQPVGRSVKDGSGVAFYVVAEPSDVALKYQWQMSLDGGFTWADISGAVGNPYIIPSVTMNDDGRVYRVIVSNEFGKSVTSKGANLEIVHGTFNGYIPVSTVKDLRNVCSENTAISDYNNVIYTWGFNSKYYLTNDITMPEFNGTDLVVNLTVEVLSNGSMRISTNDWLIGGDAWFGGKTVNFPNDTNNSTILDIPTDGEYALTIRSTIHTASAPLVNYAFQYSTIIDTSSPGIKVNETVLRHGNYYIRPDMPFTGTFDGNGHTVYGMVSAQWNYSGFFPQTLGATIKNLNMAGGWTSSSPNGEVSAYAGGIVGYAGYGTKIINCSNSNAVFTAGNRITYAGGIVGYADHNVVISGCGNTGRVEGCGISAYAGGIVGLAGGVTAQSNTKIADSYNTAQIRAIPATSGQETISGGIAGFSKMSVSGCYNLGDVSGHGWISRVGGIIGTSGAILSVTDCYNKGNISATHATGYQMYLGGIIGNNNNSSDAVTISYCYNDGNVSTTSTGTYIYAGGITGYVSATISMSYNTGNVSAVSSTSSTLPAPWAYAGGISGISADVFNSYNTGNVTAKSYQAVAGGILGGQGNKMLANCYNTGIISAVGTYRSYGGGIAGSITGYIVNCYYLTGTATVLYAEGNTPTIPTTSRTLLQQSGFKDAADMTRVSNPTALYYPGSTSGMGTFGTVQGWDFTSSDPVWGIYSGINNSYPVLRHFHSGGSYADNVMFGITKHPADQNVAIDESASFSVTVSVEPNVAVPLYQWMASYDGGMTWSNISGANGRTYTVPPVTGNCDGWMYKCVVTVNGISLESRTGMIHIVHMDKAIPVSTQEELSWVSTNQTHIASYDGVLYKWSNTATYYLTQDILIETDSNGGINLNMTVEVEAGGTMKVSLANTAYQSAGPLNVWFAGQVVQMGSAPGLTGLANFSDIPTDGVYTLTIGGVLVMGGVTYQLAYSCQVDTTSPGVISRSFNSNGNFTPIGKDITFLGSFDGNGHVISGVNVAAYDESTVYGGLFYVSGGSSKVVNLGLVNSTVTVCSRTGDAYAYGIGAFSYIADCYSSASVSAAAGSTAYAGGMSGSSNSVIIECFNTGTISANGANTHVGGIMGISQGGSISTSYNTGEIKAASKIWSYAGGIAGSVTTSASISILNSYNRGAVSTYSPADGSAAAAGGIAGSISSPFATVSNCYNTATIGSKARSTVYVAGICAYNVNDLTILESFNSGALTAISPTDSMIGGIFAASWTMSVTMNVSKCYNTGDITVDNSVGNYRVGGIGGGSSANSPITKSYNSGAITITGKYVEAGGIVGLSHSSVTDCYNVGNITVTSPAAGASVGGIAGTYYSMVTNAYNTGALSLTGISNDIGGIIGIAYTGTYITNCYYLQDSLVSNDICGYGQYVQDGGTPGTPGRAGINASGAKTDAQLKGSNNNEIFYTGTTSNVNGQTVLGWDFYGTWILDPDTNNGYPILRGGSIPMSLYISEQPKDQYASRGSDATFTVKVTSNPLEELPRYQWYERINGTSIWTPIAGAVFQSYTIRSVTDAMDGNSYRCVITKGDSASTLITATSAEATLYTKSIPVSTPQELAWIGDGLSHEASYDGISYTWTPAASYYLTQDIVFSGSDDFNNGTQLNITVEIVANGSNRDLKVTITGASPLQTTVNLGTKSTTSTASVITISSINTDGTYTMTAGGMAGGTEPFAFSCDIDTTSIGTKLNTSFNSNGNIDPINLTGTLDGNNHVISGAVVSAYSTTTAYAGLFRNISSTTTIIDLGSINGAITAISNGSNAFAGGIASNDNSFLTNNLRGLYNGSNVTAVSISGTAYAGGILGYAYPNMSISACHNEGNVTAIASANAFVGGILAYSNDSATTPISNSFNTGDISGFVYGDNGSVYAGGIAGWIRSSITGCYNTGNIKTEISSRSDSTWIGGIVGYVSANTVDDAVIDRCYNTGTVSGTSGALYLAAGGIVGQDSFVSVSNCYNTGDVKGTSSISTTRTYLSGIVAASLDSANIVVSNCYSVGNITSSVVGTKYVSGIANRLNANGVYIVNCYFLENTTDGISTLYGSTTGSADVFLDGGTNTTPGRTGVQASGAKTADQMRDLGKAIYFTGDTKPFGSGDPLTIKGWDFENIWGMNPMINSGYPILNVFNASLVFTENPVSKTVSVGTKVSFTVEVQAIPLNIGGGPRYQWQVSRNGGLNWVNIDGETARIYHTVADASNSGDLYRCAVSVGYTNVYSDTAQLNTTGIKITIVINGSGSVTYEYNDGTLHSNTVSSTTTITVPQNASVKFTNSTADPYVFIYWDADGIKTGNSSYVLKATSDKIIEAVFKNNSADDFYKVEASSVGKGEVNWTYGTGANEVIGNFVSDDDAGASEVFWVPKTSNVTFSNTPASGYVFIGWNVCKDTSASDPVIDNYNVNTYVLENISANSSVNANFDNSGDYIKLDIVVDGVGTVKWDYTYDGIDWTGSTGVDMTIYVPKSWSVQYSNEAVDPNVFTGWQIGKVTYTYRNQQVLNLSCQSDERLTAHFHDNTDEAYAKVNVGVTGNGYVNWTQGLYPGTAVMDTFVHLLKDAPVTFNASPNNSIFSRWTGDIVSTSMTPDAVTFTDDEHSLRAWFVSNANARTITLSSPNGMVYVTVNNVEYLYSAVMTVAVGDTVSFRAVPISSTYVFSVWTGSLNSNDANIPSMEVSDNINATAVFILKSASYQIKVTKNAGGDVYVRVNGIDYLYTAPFLVSNIDIVSFRAAPDSSHVFSTWSGSINSNENPTTPATVSSNMNVYATFVEKTGTQVTLTVNVTPPTAGSILYKIGDTGAWSTYSGPLTVANGTKVQFQAVVADSNTHTFSTWTGLYNGNSTTTPAFNATASGTLTAHFLTNGTDDPVTITVLADLAGSCSFEYKIGTGSWSAYTGPLTVANGTKVQFRITNAGANVFSTWTGLYNGNDPSPVITATESGTLTAKMLAPSDNPVTINVLADPTDSGTFEYKIGTGSWSVYSGALTVSAGTQVQFRTVATGTYVFSTWSGLYNGNGTTTQTFSASAGTLTAKFLAPSDNPVTINVSADPTDSGTFKYKIGTGPWSLYTGPLTVSAGAQIQFEAIPESGYVFSTWTGLFSGSSAVTQVFSASAGTLTATFIEDTGDNVIITIASSPSNTGTFRYRIGENGTWSTYTGPLTVANGTKVSFEATPISGHVFSTWTGLYNGNGATVSMTATATGTLTAVFLKSDTDQPVTVTLTSDPLGGGTFEYKIGTGEWSIYNDQLTVAKNTNVQFRAIANPGYVFSAWSGLYNGNNQTTSAMTITSTSALTAKFLNNNIDAPVTITLTADPLIGGTFEYKIGDALQWSAYTGPLTVAFNTKVQFKAVAADGYVLSTWTGLYNGNGVEIPAFNATASGEIIGHFITDSGSNVVIKVTADPLNAGTFRYKIGDAVQWSVYNGDLTVAYGTKVQFMAVAADGQVFSAWTGLYNGNGVEIPEFNATMSGGIIGHFIPISGTNVIITVTSDPTGAGTFKYKIAAGEWSVYNGPLTVVTGTQVQFQTAPEGSNVFSTWSGLYNGNGTTTPTFIVTATGELKATFLSSPDAAVVIDVTAYPSGSGTFKYKIGTGSWSAYNGPLTVEDGAQVQFQAFAEGGYVFSRWTGLYEGNGTTTPAFNASAGTLTGNFISSTDNPVTITVLASPDGSGTFEYKIDDTGQWSVYNGPLSVPYGSDVRVRATATGTYVFSTWSGLYNGNVSIVLLSNVTSSGILTATFIAPANDPITITVTESPQYSGTFKYRIDGGAWSAYAGPLTVASGTSVQFEAFAEGGYVFSRWTGAITGNSNPSVAKEFENNSAITAVFLLSGSEMVTVDITHINGNVYYTIENEAEALYAGTLTVPKNTKIVFRAEGIGDHVFSRWLGGHTGSAHITPAVTVSSNIRVEAVFIHSSADPVTITINYDMANGKVYYTIGSEPEAMYDGPLTVPRGTVISLRAAAESGYAFQKWMPSGYSLANYPYTASATAAIEALFIPSAGAKKVTVTAGTNATVSWTYAGGTGSTTSTAIFYVPQGTEVTFSQTVAQHYVFLYWTVGTEFDGSLSKKVRINTDYVITATTGLNDDGQYFPVNLTIITGSGAGSVKWSYSSVTGTMPSSGTFYVPYGANVIFTAQPAEGSVFLYWTVDSVKTGGYQFPMNNIISSRNITATFEDNSNNEFALVNVVISGTGNVTWRYSDVSGVLASTGSFYMPVGQNARFTANSVSPWVFSYWTVGSSNISTSEHTMNNVTSERTITAKFSNSDNTPQHRVDVSVAGTGKVSWSYTIGLTTVTGETTSSTHFYVPEGANVKFGNSVESTNVFLYWTVGSSNIGDQEYNMKNIQSAMSITGTFVNNTGGYKTIYVVVEGLGTVTWSYPGANVSGTITAPGGYFTVPVGTDVTFVSVPGTNYAFSHWAIGSTNYGNPTHVVKGVSDDITITANFVNNGSNGHRSVTLNISGQGTVAWTYTVGQLTVSDTLISTGTATVTFWVPNGANVIFAQTATGGSVFLYWTSNGAGYSNSPFPLNNVTLNQTVTATFASANYVQMNIGIEGTGTVKWSYVTSDSIAVTGSISSTDTLPGIFYVPRNATVTFSTETVPNNVFLYWSVPAKYSSQQYTFDTVTSEKTITATFADNSSGDYKNVTVSATGKGTVSWSYDNNTITGSLTSAGASATTSFYVLSSYTVDFVQTATSPFVFLYWTVGGANIGNSVYALNPAQNSSVTATFVDNTSGLYDLVSVTMAGSGTGEVRWTYTHSSVNVSGSFMTDGEFYAPVASTVTFSNYVQSPNIFLYWTVGGVNYGDQTYGLKVADDQEITATFNANSTGYVKVDLSMSDAGKVTWSYDTGNVSGTLVSAGTPVSTFFYALQGTDVQFVPVYEAPISFDGWDVTPQGDSMSTVNDNPLVISSISVSYDIVSRSVNSSGGNYRAIYVEVEGDGKVVYSVNNGTPGTITASGVINAEIGDNVTLTASGLGDVFLYWTVGGSNISNSTYIIESVQSSASLKAVFHDNSDNLYKEITVTADGVGTVKWTYSNGVVVTGSLTSTGSASTKFYALATSTVAFSNEVTGDNRLLYWTVGTTNYGNATHLLDVSQYVEIAATFVDISSGYKEIKVTVVGTGTVKWTYTSPVVVSGSFTESGSFYAPATSTVTFSNEVTGNNILLYWTVGTTNYGNQTHDLDVTYYQQIKATFFDNSLNVYKLVTVEIEGPGEVGWTYAYNTVTVSDTLAAGGSFYAPATSTVNFSNHPTGTNSIFLYWTVGGVNYGDASYRLKVSEDQEIKATFFGNSLNIYKMIDVTVNGAGLGTVKWTYTYNSVTVTGSLTADGSFMAPATEIVGFSNDVTGTNVFLYWTVGGVNYGNPTYDLGLADTEIEATFVNSALNQHKQVTVEFSAGGSGVVDWSYTLSTLSVSGSFTSNGSFWVPVNANILFEQSATYPSVFLYWTIGTLHIGDPTYTVNSITTHMTIGVTFDDSGNYEEITVNVTGKGTVHWTYTYNMITVTGSATSVTNGTVTAKFYAPADAEIGFTQESDDNDWVFLYWTVDNESYGNQAHSIDVTEDRAISAVFGDNSGGTYKKITVEITGVGSVAFRYTDLTPTTVNGVFTSPTDANDFFWMPVGIEARFTASPGSNYVFLYWMIGATKTGGSVLDKDFTSDTTVKAVFEDNRNGDFCNVTVTMIGTGTVNWSYGNVSGEMTSSGTIAVPKPSVVHFTASYHSPNVFLYWMVNGLKTGTETYDLSVTSSIGITAMFDDNTSGEYAKIDLTVTGGGTVGWTYDDVVGSMTTGGTFHVKKTSNVTFTATPNSGNVFSRWTLPNSETVAVTPMIKKFGQDTEMGAVFTGESGQVMIRVNVTGMGTVRWSSTYGSGFTTTSFDLYVPAGTKVTFTYEASSGYVFSRWTGAYEGNGQTIEVTVSGNTSLEAIFLDENTDPLVITITAFGDNGKVYYSINGGTEGLCSGPLTVEKGSSIVLRAVPNENYTFSTWRGDINTNKNPTDPTVFDDDVDIEAVFVLSATKVTVTVTASPAAGGTIQYKIGSGEWSECTGSLTVASGTYVQFRAMNADGYVFSTWTGLYSGNGIVTPSIPITQNGSITGMFVLASNTATVTVTADPVNGGTFEYDLNESGVWSVYNGPLTVAKGTKVQIRATATGSNTFSAWVGAYNGNAQTTPVMTVTDNISLTGKFIATAGSITLTVDASPDGSGTFEYKIGDGPWSLYERSLIVTAGTQVQFRATPTGSYVFSTWTGLYNGNGIDSTTPVLTPMQSGTITGVFVSGPAGNLARITIVCDPLNGGKVMYKIGDGPWSEYSEPVVVTKGTKMQFQAVAANGYVFSTWTGLYNGNALFVPETEITLDSTLTAKFLSDQADLPVTITVTASPDGSGTFEYKIGDGPWSIYDGQLTVAYNAQVQFRATAVGGYTLSTWTGMYNGNGVDSTTPVLRAIQIDTLTGVFISGPASNWAKVTLVADPTIGGTFEYKIGNGTWSAYNGPLTVAKGTKVTFRAVTADGYTLSTWTGLYNGNGVVTPEQTITEDCTLTGVFILSANSVTVTVSADPSDGGMFEYRIGENGTWSAYNGPLTVAKGTTVYINAIADSDFVFSTWTRAYNGNQNPAVLTVTENASLTAMFIPNSRSPMTLTVNHVNGSVKYRINGGPWSELYGNSLVVDVNSSVEFQAFADDGYQFVEWIGFITGSKNPTDPAIVMGSDVLNAVFAVSDDSGDDGNEPSFLGLTQTQWWLLLLLLITTLEVTIACCYVHLRWKQEEAEEE